MALSFQQRSIVDRSQHRFGYRRLISFPRLAHASCRARSLQLAVQARKNSTDLPDAAIDIVRDMADMFWQRYEATLLGSGTGALAVTTWCIAHGQSLETAATITGFATVMALVVNELLSGSEDNGMR